MNRFFVFIVAFIAVVFGLQTPSVVATAPQCETLKSWSPTDATLFNVQLDDECMEYFIEPEPTELYAGKYLQRTISTSTSSFNPADAFTLHSNPDANAIIYLDFDGQTWESGMWWIGSYGIDVGETSAGFTLDNNPNDFTETERNAIIEIWSNVAEDFAVYNVDVTTERPTGARETIFKARGSHALILSEATVQEGCGCGGVAYVDVFANGDAWDYPALNFSKFGSYYAAPIDVAEIISHEVGHNLGLAHDGTTTGIEYYGGHEMWTPIMGAGRGRGIATWSYGGYPFADTRWDQRAGDDDFAQMNTFMDFFADDHGNNFAQATDISTNSLIQGKITTQSDMDFFKFTVSEAAQGMWEMQILPAPYAPNLDPELKLYDENGNVLATSNPLVSPPAWMTYITSGLDALIERELSAGTYYLSIDGVGQGLLSNSTGYDDYASRGNYQLRLGSPLTGVFVESVTPSTGGRGTAVEINGSNLDGVNGLRLGSTQINTYSIVSEGRIVFGIPAGASSGRLTLETDSGDVTALENLTVLSSAAAPTISSLSSNSGVESQTITVSGSNLGSTTALTLAGVAIDFDIVSRDSLQFQVVAGMNTGKLSLTTDGGTVEARGTFTVLIPLTIESFSPTSAAVGGTVVITGTNFTSNTSVTFYGGAKASRPSISATQITVKVPRSALSGPITLSNSLGSSSTLSNFVIAAPAPTISGISPTSARDGATITVNGSNFVNVQSVRLGSLSLSFTVVSATRIQFVVPVGASSGNVTVTTLSGSATSRSQLRIR